MANMRNRGMHLERLLDRTHIKYFRKGVADVRKIPTPVQIKSNNGGRITGFTQKGEFVDYLGVVDGRPIIFDAKETTITTSFPLKNIGDHQFDILKSWHEKGAHAFLIVNFAKRFEEIYMLPFTVLETAWTGYKGDGRKSIPYETFVTECPRIRSEDGYELHYINFLRGAKS